VSFSAFLFLLTIATSSAYANICVLFIPILPVMFIFWNIASKTRSNSIADIASPCLIPLVMGKVDVYWLSTLCLGSSHGHTYELDQFLWYAQYHKVI
jgi:hypothetical protein